LLTLGAPCAFADTFGFDLGFGSAWTGNGTFTGPFAHVVVSTNGTNTATVTFTSLSSGGFQYRFTDGGVVALNLASAYNLGNGNFNGTVSATISSANVLFTGQAITGCSNAASQQEDGFGNFNVTCNAFDSFHASGDTVVVMLVLSSGTFSNAAGTAAGVLVQNNEIAGAGSKAAAHVGAWDGTFADGFAATGFAGDAQCKTCPEGQVTATPEPGTITMLGGGLLAVAFALRRRFGLGA